MYEVIITPTSQRIADAIRTEMRMQNIRPSELEKKLKGVVNEWTVRRIRKGASGATLRSYEQILDILGLRLAVLPKSHPDIID